jgi:hypothetical protein
MFQKRSAKAPKGAEVRRSTNRLICEVADQGQKRPISTAMRKQSRNEAGGTKAPSHREPHHGFCKSTITRRQYLPPVNPYRPALFTVSHIAVSVNYDYQAPESASWLFLPWATLRFLQRCDNMKRDFDRGAGESLTMSIPMASLVLRTGGLEA